MKSKFFHRRIVSGGGKLGIVGASWLIGAKERLAFRLLPAFRTVISNGAIRENGGETIAALAGTH